MNSRRLEKSKQALLLCGLLLVSNLANAQWVQSKIETLTDEANRLKDQGFFESAYQLYPEIMFQMRVHEGLFSVKQLPMLMEMSAWHVRRGDFEQADDLLDRAEFYVDKNSDPIEGYRKLVVQRLYLPDEQRCFEKEEDGFINSSMACDSLRYFRADSFIAATEIMIKAVKISNDRKSDLVALAGLAEFTAFCVYDMYEAENTKFEYNAQADLVYKSDETILQEKYKYKKWTNVHRRTLSQLETEFNFEVL